MINLECIKGDKTIFTKKIDNKISSLTNFFSYLNMIGIDEVKISSGNFEATIGSSASKQKLAEISLGISDSYSGLVDEKAIEDKIESSHSHVQATLMAQRINPALMGNRTPSDFAKDYNRLLALS